MRAGNSPHHRGKRREHAVTYEVSVRIVHRLELVQVEECHAKGFAFQTGGKERIFCRLAFIEMMGPDSQS